MSNVTTDQITAIVLFSGPGGTCTGLRDAGLDHIVGVEYEENAVATSRAAGHETILGDVRTIDPITLANDIKRRKRLLVQLSPPCQGLSMAGKGKGRDDLVFLLEALANLAADQTLKHQIPQLLEWLTEVCSDDKSPLTFEVVRWVAELNPNYVMLEQVPAALPIWEAFAEVLRTWGYKVWTGNVQAEQFGVPQTRKRAVLMATKHGDVVVPQPTHSKYHNRNPEKLDEGVLPWVSMAEALGWGATDQVGFPRKYDGIGEAIEIDGEEYRARDLREASQPSFAVSGKARSWVRYPGERPLDLPDEEIEYVNGTGKNACRRSADKPAPTVHFGARLNTVEWQPTHMGDVYNSKGCIRSVTEPAPTMTASMDNGNFQWIDEENPPAKAADRVAAKPHIDHDAVREEVEPRVHNQSGTEFDLTWPAKRPAPVIAGRDIVTMPGANANRFNGSTKSRNDGIRVTAEEAGILQSFPADYQWKGTKTAVFQQIGNAVPPLLQRALTEQLLHLSASVSNTESKEDVA